MKISSVSSMNSFKGNASGSASKASQISRMPIETAHIAIRPKAGLVKKAMLGLGMLLGAGATMSGCYEEPSDTVTMPTAPSASSSQNRVSVRSQSDSVASEVVDSSNWFIANQTGKNMKVLYEGAPFINVDNSLPAHEPSTGVGPKPKSASRATSSDTVNPYFSKRTWSQGDSLYKDSVIGQNKDGQSVVLSYSAGKDGRYKLIDSAGYLYYSDKGIYNRSFVTNILETDTKQSAGDSGFLCRPAGRDQYKVVKDDSMNVYDNSTMKKLDIHPKNLKIYFSKTIKTISDMFNPKTGEKVAAKLEKGGAEALRRIV